MKNAWDKLNKKAVCIALALVIVIIAIVIVTPNKNGNDSPIGDYQVSGEKLGHTIEADNKTEEHPSITFVGYVKSTVSKDDPYVELKNPDNNFVDFHFRVYDAESREEIINTDILKPGESLDVDIYNFYKEAGIYKVLVRTFALDSGTEEALESIDQEMEVHIN